MAVDDEQSPPAPTGIEAEIDALLAEFGGDARRAIAALLHDIAVLAADAAASTSRGYTRGRVLGPRRPLRQAGGEYRQTGDKSGG